MTKRKRQDQTKHDQAVKASADYYSRQGYKVQADIKGYEQPGSFNGRRPDLAAKKGTDQVLLEVELPGSVQSDRAQRDALQQYADAHKNTRFRTKVVKDEPPKKKRKRR